MMHFMHVDADLCGGSIVGTGHRHGTEAELSLRADSAAGIRQWFHFRVRGARGRDVELTITDAGQAMHPDAFHGYRALASYDLERWFRVPTDFDGRRLVLRHRPEHDTVHYSYFAAYPLERLGSLLSVVDRNPRARVRSIGASAEGRPIPLVVFGEEAPGKRRLWLAGRQHPGETMGSWFVEGALARLLAEDDPVTDTLLHEAVVYVVPMVNPDGSTRGNFRTNAAGRDLNREWQAPSPEASPEVLAVRSVMEQTGVDLFLDVHGDEHADVAFAIGCAGNPGYSERLYELERRFARSLARRDGGFSSEFDYGADDPGKGDLRIGNNWVGERFDCLSLTIEMPFKEGPSGFGPDRAEGLGRTSLEAVLESLGVLR
ncbi:M14-type cytosolic carboxypeptidase [Polyangium sp. 15x6]|nr:M14-type cytosolic carboxypeptidase [Polyangium sp. 15x6]